MSFDHPTVVELLATQWDGPGDGSQSWNTYGITAAVRTRIIEIQGGRCAICNEHKGDRLVIDHCHTTGRARGLICSGCNTRLGKACDAIEWLQHRAHRYTRAEKYIRHAARIGKDPKRAAWVTRVARKQAGTLPEVPKPVPPPVVRAPKASVGLVDLWPTDLRMPPRVVTAKRVRAYGNIAGSCWCPVEKADQYEGALMVPGRTIIQESSGETGTTMALVQCRTVEEQIGAVTLAFLKAIEDVVEGDAYFAWQDIFDKARRVAHVDALDCWHHKAATFFPFRIDCRRFGRDAIGVSERFMVDGASGAWRELVAHWAIVDLRQEATPAESDGYWRARAAEQEEHRASFAVALQDMFGGAR